MVCALAAAAMLPATASAQDGGGTPAPAVTGGAQYGDVPALERPAALRVRHFRLSPATIAAGASNASHCARARP